MERELDPNLFGEDHSNRLKNEYGARQQQARFEDIEAQIDLLHSQMKTIRESTLQLQSFAREQAKISQTRHLKIIEKFKAFDYRMSELSKAQTNDFRKIRSQIKDQRIYDEKVKMMVERHNQIVQSFEQRLSQVTKMMQQKDLQLSIAKNALQEHKKD